MSNSLLARNVVKDNKPKEQNVNQRIAKYVSIIRKDRMDLKMVETLEPMIDAPIAGQSLTAELGNRPWQQPPQYTTVEEVLEFYVPRLTNPEMLDDLF